MVVGMQGRTLDALNELVKNMFPDTWQRAEVQWKVGSPVAHLTSGGGRKDIVLEVKVSVKESDKSSTTAFRKLVLPEGALEWRSIASGPEWWG